MHLHQAPTPDGNESEPSSDVEDDFEDADLDFDSAEGLAAREAEHERAALLAQQAGASHRAHTQGRTSPVGDAPVATRALTALRASEAPPCLRRPLRDF